MVALHQARMDAARAARCGGAARAVSLPEVAVWTAEDEASLPEVAVWTAEDEALLTGWLEARAQACTTTCAEVHGMDVGTAQEEARVEYLAEGRRAYWRSYMSEHPVLKAQLREGGGGAAPGAGAAGGGDTDAAAAAAAAAAAMPGGGLRAAAQTGAWHAACAALPAVTAASLQLLHGFNVDEILPRGCAPQPGALRLEPRTQLLVSRLPAGSGGGGGGAGGQGAASTPTGHASLMLHGWLFASYAASGRKAHQKFPLFCLSGATNLAPPPADGGPQWLPLPPPPAVPAGGGAGDAGEAGEGQTAPAAAAAVGYADQHVHKDEPIDLGGFLFCEVFFGSDMARVAPASNTPASVWVTAVDVESGRAVVALVVMLPAADPAVAAAATAVAAGGAEAAAAAEAALDAAVAAASSPAEVAAALRARWGDAAQPVAVQLGRL
jgi:hypothetical protein